MDEKREMPEKLNREDLFIRNLFLNGYNVHKAALNAGYSNYYAKSGIYQKTKSKRFQDKIREYAIANDIINLPKIAYIEEQVIDHLVENPLEISHYKEVIKQKKQIAGVLKKDNIDGPKIVNIGQLIQARNILAPKMVNKPKAIEAEIENTE